MFKRKGQRNPMLERIGPEFQCLKEKGWNSDVKKDRDRNPALKKDRVGILMFEKIGPKFEC